jgi:hypothetical protein
MRSSLLPQYTFDDGIGRYRNIATGRLVARTEIRSAVDQLVLRSSENMVAIAEKFQSGTIGLHEFSYTMAQAVKQANVAACVAAKGGFQNMKDVDWLESARGVKKQYGYLGRWMDDLSVDAAPRDGRLLVRASMYGNGARELYEQAYRADQADYGNDEEMGVLHAAESCDDCIARADMGWVPLGTLPAIGDSACDGRCMCTMEYRQRPAPALAEGALAAEPVTYPV